MARFDLTDFEKQPRQHDAQVGRDTTGCMAYGENGTGPHQLTSILGTYNGATCERS